MSDYPVVGNAGRLIMPTRGDAGPGEVLVRYKGGSEAFLAWSPEPLAVGEVVMVMARRGPREYDVLPWQDLGLDPPAPDVPLLPR